MNKVLGLLFSLVLWSSVSMAQSSFPFQNRQIQPGTKEHFMVPIVSGQDTTAIPITVFNGVVDGETLGITAGVHGYEYAPILAGQKLVHSINPQKLKGVVILVQVAALESFLGRSPYISPIDGKNLNRSFPGGKNGTNTEKVANFISEEIIARADYFLDMHSGDAPEDLMSYGAYYSNQAMPEASARGMDMAASLGFEHLVVFNTDGKDYMKKDEKSLYCSAEAFKRGIPSIDIECGRLGIIEEDAIKRIEKSVLNLLEHLDFLPNENVKTAANSPILITNRVYMSSNFDGIFYPSKKAGDQVTKGMSLGYVTDYFGNVLETIYAEESGLLLLIIGTPPVSVGEDLVVIAKID